MLEVLGSLMPIAVGVIVSPVPVIAAILVATSRRGASNGPAFALGWFVGVLLLVLLFSLLGAGGGETPVFVHWVNLILGLLLWWLAWREYRNRGNKELPAWVKAVDDLEPHKAALSGLLLATIASPKSLPLGAATGVIIAESGMGAAETVIACVVFAAVSSAGMVLAAVLRFTAAGAAALGRLKEWLADNAPAITIPLFLVLGTLIINSSVQAIQGP